MRRFLPVRAVSLHERAVILNGQHIVGASIFPFFDRYGVVSQILIVDPVAIELSVCQPGDVVKLPWFQAVEIRNAQALGRADILDVLSAFWHYDPWWILTKPAFSLFEAVPVLKQTNCVDHFTREVTGLYYSGNLQRITAVYKQTGEEYSQKKFDPAMLRRRERQNASTTVAPRGWVLAPFWQTD